MKKTMVAITAFMLCLAGISAGGNVQAESVGSLQEKKSTIEKKKSTVESGISEAENKITDIEKQRASLEAELKKVEKSIADTKEKITKKDKEIASTKEKIDSLKESIKETEERIANRHEILKERARSYQQNGSSTYLEVILGANSFGEFVERIGAVTTIMNADKDIIAEQEADKARLEEQKAEVETKLASLNEMKKELVKMKEELDGKKVEKNQLMAVLKSEQAQLEEEKLSLEEEKELLTNQESAVKKAIAAEKKRQAEAAAAAAASANSSSTVSSGTVSQAPAVTSGKFMRPAAGYVSSRFGSRWGKNHNGIDIAKSGTVPVVASAAGVVSRANYSSSYGNVIYISHYIDGQVYTTVYAHLRSMNVSAGQSVQKGQQIGLMGNTGRSFGQHLHFELYVGGWTASKSNAVDPLKYLSGM